MHRQSGQGARASVGTTRSSTRPASTCRGSTATPSEWGRKARSRVTHLRLPHHLIRYWCRIRLRGGRRSQDGGERRVPGLGARGVLQPFAEAHEVDGGGGQEVTLVSPG